MMLITKKHTNKLLDLYNTTKNDYYMTLYKEGFTILPNGSIIAKTIIENLDTMNINFTVNML